MCTDEREREGGRAATLHLPPPLEESVQLNQCVTHPQRNRNKDRRFVLEAEAGLKWIPWARGRVLDPYTAQRLRHVAMDNFFFKWSGVVCSLELDHLRRCWRRERDRYEQQGQGQRQQDAVMCSVERDTYAHCLYRRFDAAFAFVALRNCKARNLAYHTCAMLSNSAAPHWNRVELGGEHVDLLLREQRHRSASRGAADVKMEGEAAGVLEYMREENRLQPAMCDTLWKDLYMCIAGELRLETYPFTVM